MSNPGGKFGADKDLAARIAAIKDKTPVGAARVHDYLTDEGVQVDTRAAAEVYLAGVLAQLAATSAELRGTSLGLSAFVWTDAADDTHTVDKPTGGLDWTQLCRTHDTLVRRAQQPDSATAHTFRLTPGVHGAKAAYVDIVAVQDPPPRHTHAEQYPTGTALRLSDGEQFAYVRVGGLLDDRQLVNLTTMKPMNDVSGWTVIEEL